MSNNNLSCLIHGIQEMLHSELYNQYFSSYFQGTTYVNLATKS